MSTILGDLLSTKSLYSHDPIDHYIFDHSLRYTPEQRELLDDIKNLPGMKIYLLLINRDFFLFYFLKKKFNHG
jgi:hypothetical protein